MKYIEQESLPYVRTVKSILIELETADEVRALLATIVNSQSYNTHLRSGLAATVRELNDGTLVFAPRT